MAAFDPRRREALRAAALAAVAGGGAAAGFGRGEAVAATPAAATVATGANPAAAQTGAAGGGTSWEELRLWYPRPATQWVEALPLGNGRLGAMVWGGGKHERLQLNEDTLYAGGPYDPTPLGALEALPEVRRLLFARRYAEAEALANATMLGRPPKQMPYQPLGDLVLDFFEIAETNGYRRELDLDRALATSTFEARGLQHRREVFVSPVDQCLAMRLSGDTPGRISLRIGLASDQPSATVDADGDAGLLLRGRNEAAFGVDGRLRFAARLRVLPVGGTLQQRDGRIEVRDADEVVLLLTAATSFRRYDDVSGDPDAITRDQLARAAARSWQDLHDDHVAAHRTLFRRVEIDLGATPVELAQLPTDERVARFADAVDPALAALYHQFGRYLLIASSRAGSQPANLQGVWNDLLQPPWESKYTININTEMNYWPAESGALAECVEPLERMVFELAERGRETARRMYGAPGWVVHHNTDLWRATAPIDGAQWGLWPLGGAWLLQHLWDRWDYGRDVAYLRRIYPLFRGAAEFFEATLVEDPHTGAMVTAPSISPENVHPHGAALCTGPSMDAQLLRDLFGQCIEAAALLQIDADFAQRLRRLRERLPPHRIGRAGQLQEWQDDWDMDAPEMDHRHVSHLYALHPSSQINPRDTPELVAAARRSLEIRGDEATGWGIGWRLNLWARLRDGERAMKILRMLLSPSRTYPNLFDAHPPFQIDGNFGGTAGITEMLVQSWGGAVFLLPALPRDWPTGTLHGVPVRNAARLDLSWRDGVVEAAVLRSERGGDYRVDHRGRGIALALAAGESATLAWRDGALVRA
ncbi:glycoside hydrolase family 95 protein [Luteimonas kalidii]|uniref:Glycoside hydrolase family 95 protein n=1 Tax=Luteimonas kalidii TaxID=3042025 RepID=A0ABT6JVA0_9GAMM|nr:glycoside hydrolase family 95 protein [Luteimonas kalidii]MDH5834418.1 glycoside hydrolase family 95 protein [Luteimonas kalidii]